MLGRCVPAAAFAYVCAVDRGSRLDGDRVVESDLRDVETVGVTQIVGQEARVGHLGWVGVLANVTLCDKPYDSVPQTAAQA
jgi:hypothetical protein